MATPSWLRRLSRHHLTAPVRPRFRPAVSLLEDRCTPSITLTGITVTPSPISEGGTATLAGTVAGFSVGDMTATVNWGDGTAADVFTVAAGSTTFTRTHVYADDNPTNTASDVNNVTCSIVDSAPTAAIVGPNTAGYRAYEEPYWNINLTTGGAGTTTVMGTNQDDTSLAYDLGTDSFRFYGTNYTGANQLFASSNGLITFGSSNSAYSNAALATGLSQAAIAPFWDDMITDSSSGAVLARKVDVDGNGVNDYLILEWHDIRDFNATANKGVFQAILQLNTGATNGDVILNYGNTTFGGAAADAGAGATVGIKNTGTAAATSDPVQVSFNAATNLVRDHNAVRFTTQNLASTPDPLAGANTFGYRAQKRPFLAPGNNLDLIAGNPGVTTIMGNGQDDTSTAYDLGGNVFRLYNTNYTGTNKLFACSNGFLSFGTSDTTYANPALTSPTEAVIAPFWDDLHTSTGSGAVLAKLVDLDGNGVNDFLIIEWSQICLYADQTAADNGTWQVILQVNTGNAAGDIYFNYVDTTFAAGNAGNTGGSATIGIKDANSPGPADPQQLSLNAAYAPIADGNALSFLGTKGAATTAVTVNNVAPAGLTLTPTVTTVNEGSSTTLNGSFTDPGTGDTHTVTINWNDGSSNTVLNLAAGVLTFSSTHSYADDNPTGTSSDTVAIQVTVADDDTGSVNGSTNITVNNVAPTITALSGTTINENQSTTVSGTFTDPGTLDTHTVRLAWQDGTADTVLPLAAGVLTFSTTHQYLDDNPTNTASDVYAVAVTITDDDTGTATGTANVTVNNVAPTITTMSATTINENQSTTLTGTIADVGTLDTHRVTITWNDGSANTVLNLGVGVLTFSTTHQYLDDNPTGTSSDNVTIQVNVTDDDTGSVSGTTAVTINNLPPAITALSATATTINENDSTTINGTFTDPGTLDTHTVTINWRDGTPNTVISNLAAGVTTFSATHQYLDDSPTGTPSDVEAIQVTVADDDTGSTTGTVNVTVNNIAPTITSFTFTPTSLNEGQLATASGTFTDPGTLDSHTVTINWRDGSPNTVLSLSAGTLSFSTTHTYADDSPSGTPSDVVGVQVTVADDDFGSASTSTNVTINNVAPTVTITGAPASSPEGTPITLTANVVDPGTLDTFSYAWTVTKNGNLYAGFTGQGTGAIVLTPDDNGTFVVHLTVTDDDTGVGTAPAVTITATNVAPAPMITAPATSPEGSPLTVTANPNDPGAADQATLTYAWTVTKNGNPYAGFTGQGTASIVLTPDDNGTYAAAVTVTDKDGGTGSASKSITVTNVAPTATLTNDGPKPANTNINYTFNNRFDPSTVDTAAGFTYSYDFNNDGNFTSPGDILNSSSPTAAFSFATIGTYTVRGRIKDKDGGFTDVTSTVTLIAGNGGVVSTPLYATGAGAGGGPDVEVYNLDGTKRFGIFAYNSTFSGGVRVATGDVNGDGVDDIVTAPGAGGGPDVRVFDGKTGAMIREFMAYDKGFTGGVFVAVADVNHDHFADIITGAGAGGGPHVKAFSGWDNGLQKSFLAYSGTFSGGVSVAGGDMDGDGFAEIITGAGAGGGPHVKAFNGKTDALVASFMAFAPGFSGGVSVAAGDLTHDGRADIIAGTGPDPAAAPRVRAFDAVGGAMIRDFPVYQGLTGGVRVGVTDLNGDGVVDFIIAPGAGNSAPAPSVLILDGVTLESVRTFSAYDPSFLGGVYVG